MIYFQLHSLFQSCLPVVNILAKVSVILGRVNNNVGPWTETKIIYLCSETCIIQPRDY